MSKSASALHRPRLLLVAVAALLVVVGTTACQPRQPDKSRPVLFIHGWNAFGGGSDCQSTFGGLESSLRDQGFTGPMVTVGFYDSDRNCDVNLRSWGNVDNGSSWKDLSKAFSKYVHDTYTVNGQHVDVVGHSMGGLIVRGAVYGSQISESGFSTPLLVEDVVTLAAPHDGAAWYSSFCLWGQCASLKPGASEINWVNQNGNPQALGGTDFTVFGSTNDDVVPDESATHMSLPAQRVIVYSNLEHSDYMNDPATRVRTAKALAEVDW